MFMVYNQALVTRTSNSVSFFKLVYNDETKKRDWVLYHTLEIRGFVYYMKGNIRIQISTAEKVYFYIIDKETLEPELENVMYNYMNCI